MKTRASYLFFHAIPAFLLFIVAIISGCSTVEAPRVLSTRHADLLDQYPQTGESLKLHRITTAADPLSVNHEKPGDAYIFVHPAYALFFRDWQKDPVSEAKYRLLKKQFDDEAAAILSLASSGNIVILVVPGNYSVDSVAPGSYVSYLNAVSAGDTVHYVPSETSSSGSLAVEDVVNLYQFLKKKNIGKIMIGGGYIGRCQREFYNQFVTKLDRMSAYIVPEISTISPDDITEEEARVMTDRIWQQDYTRVRAFIDKKYSGKALIIPITKK